MIATKRKIETEQDRFGGFSRSYNTDVLSSSLIATPSYIEPTEDDVKDEVFEVEKEYKMDDFTNKTVDERQEEKFVMPTITRKNEEKTSLYESTRKEKLKLNARGKIILSVFSCIVMLLVGFSIYNAVVISNLNGTISAKQATVVETQYEIQGLENSIDNMSSESSINSKLDMKFRKVTDNDKMYLDETEKTEVPTYEEPTNFFDKLCNFFSNIL